MDFKAVKAAVCLRPSASEGRWKTLRYGIAILQTQSAAICPAISPAILLM
jgi:hypothetical protein